MARYLMLAFACAAALAAKDLEAADDCAFVFSKASEGGLGSKEPLLEPPATQDGHLASGTTFPDTSTDPYRNFYRLDTIVNGVNRFCTAQVVGAPNVLLTAAHCVQDNGNGQWVDHFQLRSLRDQTAEPITNPKCMMTQKAWTEIPAGFPGRFYWPADYALVVMPDPLNQAFLSLDQAPAGSAALNAFGLPTGIGRHNKLVEITGELKDDPSQPGQGLVLHHQPDAALGMSGGAWVLETSSEGATKRFTVVGLSTTADQIDASTFGLIGPRFNECAQKMLQAVQQQCGP